MPKGIACPRCEQDYVIEAIIKPLHEQIRICPECDAFWDLSTPVLLETFRVYGDYIEGKGFTWDWNLLEIIDLAVMGTRGTISPPEERVDIETEMNSLKDQIRGLLDHVPRAPETLLPDGATEQELVEFENSVGLVLPNELKEWLRKSG